MEGSVRAAAHRGTKVAFVAFDVVRPPGPGTVLLAYHRVGGGSGLEVDLDPGVFVDQLSMINESCGAESIDAAVARLKTQELGESPPVVITFDDGTADFMEHVLPALVNAGVPATYYIATEFIEDQTLFPDGGVPLSWSALREAVDTGLVTIGSHTHSHAVMDKVTHAEAVYEVQRSAGLIEERLGVRADHFAYPKGVFGGEDIERVVKDGFTTAALANCRSNPVGANLHRLDRTPIQRSDGMSYFERKLSGGLRLEGVMRGALNAIRYRYKTN